MFAACFPWTIFLSYISDTLACLFSSSLSCFVRCHNLLHSVSMLKLAVFFIQLLLLASFLVLINLALICFKTVLLPIDGATSARFLAIVSSLCLLLFRSLLQYGLKSFLAPFGIHSFAA